MAATDDDDDDERGKPKKLKIKVLKNLNFGIIKASRIPGTISVSASQPPVVTTTGGVYAVSGKRRKPTRLRIKGEPNALVYLNLQNRTRLMTPEGDSLVLDLELNSALRHLGPSGVIKDVYIGGTLNVEPFPAAGKYKGDFFINVDYQ